MAAERAARAGGGGVAAARPAGGTAFDRSPSMSRAAPAQVQRPAAAPAQVQRPAAAPAQVQRPAASPAQIQRPAQPAAATRPANSIANRPATGGGNLAGGGSPPVNRGNVAQNIPQGNIAQGNIGVGQRAPLASTQPVQRPSQNQLNGFLNLPQQSAATRPAPPTPSQLPASGSGINSKTVIQGKNGYTAVNVRGGAVSGGVAQVGSATAIRGPGGNTIAYGRGASFVNGQFVGGQTWRAVNASFTHWHNFTPGWYARYPGCWWPGKWAVASTAWARATWAVAGSYCGCSGDGVYYDYSQNVVYDQGTVYYGDQPVATAEQYYDEAAHLATAGQNTSDEQWLPLGVFAIVAEGQTTTDKLVQLAVNKDGVVRGNYQDLLADKITPIIGSIDKETQRVAMKIEGNNLLVAETGLYNLTNDEVPLLIHVGADRQENRTLIRLDEEQAGGTAK